MHHFCTYFDRLFMARGLALHESLQRSCANGFVLWILCLDKGAEQELRRIKLDNVRLVRLSALEAYEPRLLEAKQNRSRVEFYWTCTPVLPEYVLDRDPSIDRITYLDADLYFFSDLEPVFQEMGKASVMIHEHRYAPEHEHMRKTSGVFNVGLMSFRRNENALNCLNRWREQCLEWCYQQYEDGKFGDQLYLDDWPETVNGLHVLQHVGAGAAPWNMSRYRWSVRHGRVQLDGVPLIFFHFHALRVISLRLVESVYKPPARVMRKVYLPYLRALRQVATARGVELVDTPKSLSRGVSFNGIRKQQYILIRQGWVSWLVSLLAMPKRIAYDRVGVAYKAHKQGKYKLMRQNFYRAIVTYPPVLKRLGIIPRLVESYIGKAAMKPYWSWRERRRSR